jgi:hypothetical protein
LLTLLAAPAPAAKASRIDEPLEHYNEGKKLFDDGNKAQALIEFRRSYELSGNVEALFGMAQSEYHLGRLKDARGHYEQYLKSPERSPQAAEIARLRLEAIKLRPGTVVVTSDPDEVDVRFEEIDGQGRVISGQGSNEFEVPSGRWKLTVAKKNYVAEAREIAVDVAENRPLRFKLKPVPARLEIRTIPPRATLYVRGNRARNPYIQDVEPGAYEIYAEATDYESDTDVVHVNPGERRRVVFPLRYVQRSGRPELIGFWTVAGAVAAGTAVYARINTQETAVSSTATVITAAALVGGAGGAVVSTAFVPSYIRDNLALFRIGAAWIGAAEGASLALAFDRSLTAGWVGGFAGLATGIGLGTWLDDRAPYYGRVAMIQSGAAMGALAGVALVPALGLDVDRYAPYFLFGGLNVGLAAGLTLAYLPDQTVNRPSWQRVLLVDLATAAGAVAGAVVSTLGQCLPEGGNCEFQADRRTAQVALIGGGLGLVAGWLLTSGYDRDHGASDGSSTALLPVPTLLPIAAPDGRVRPVPALAAQGRF